MTREEFARQLMREVKAGGVRFHTPSLKRKGRIRWGSAKRFQPDPERTDK